MATRRVLDARKALFAAAAEEVGRLGDRRIGTQHLFLALFDGNDSLARRVLGTDREAARRALTDLDHRALAAVGIDASPPERPRTTPSGRRPPLTSGARAVLKKAVDRARADDAKVIDERHLLLAFLDLDRPDPAATLIDELGIDTGRARSDLERHGTE